MKRPLWQLSLLGLALLAGPTLPAFAAAEATAEHQSKGSVARSAFTTAIVDREPVDNLVRVPNTVTRLYYFTDLRDLEGQIVTHRWEYQGQVMAEVKFRVAGPRWRVYSSKNLLPEWSGKWTVMVLDESGWPVQADMFEYLPAEGQQTP